MQVSSTYPLIMAFQPYFVSIRRNIISAFDYLIEIALH